MERLEREIGVMLRPMALGVRPCLAAADTTEMEGTDMGYDCWEREGEEGKKTQMWVNNIQERIHT